MFYFFLFAGTKTVGYLSSWNFFKLLFSLKNQKCKIGTKFWWTNTIYLWYHFNILSLNFYIIYCSNPSGKYSKLFTFCQCLQWKSSFLLSQLVFKTIFIDWFLLLYCRLLAEVSEDLHDKLLQTVSQSTYFTNKVWGCISPTVIYAQLD